MKQYGINTQHFEMAETPEEAGRVAKELGVREVVLKAQILAGGRGKGVFSSGLQGGVKVTQDLDSIATLTQQMIGHKLKTKQTTGDGVLVKRLMVAESLDIARETYFALVLDRSHQGPVMVGSPAGGMDIEEVAEKTPEKIFKVSKRETSGGGGTLASCLLHTSYMYSLLSYFMTPQLAFVVCMYYCIAIHSMIPQR